MKKLAIICILLCFAASTFAQRQYENRTINVSGTLGVYIPYKDGVGGLDQEIGYNFGITSEYYFNDYIGAGMFFGTTGFSLDDYYAGGRKMETDIRSAMIGATVVGRYPTPKADFYLMGGIGVAYNEARQEFTDAGRDFETTDDDTTLVFMAETGVRYYIYKGLHVGGAVKYIYNKAKFDYYLLGKTKEQIGGIGLSAAIGYSF